MIHSKRYSTGQNSARNLKKGRRTENSSVARARGCIQTFLRSTLFSSGFTANLAFTYTVPRKTDVIICSDELIHASSRNGTCVSCRRPSYPFAHNLVASFEKRLLCVLQKHPQITRGTSTAFVVVESLYSMDGDFYPLTEIVGLVKTLVPAGHVRIVVDEAHTSGICGSNGTGYVSHLGLSDRVHTKVTFGKGWEFHGGMCYLLLEYVFKKLTPMLVCFTSQPLC